LDTQQLNSGYVFDLEQIIDFPSYLVCSVCLTWYYGIKSDNRTVGMDYK